MVLNQRTVRWTIYGHIHIESGRRYIGLTKKTMMQRWNQHVLNTKSKAGRGCAHFWNAIRKYGRDSFAHHELAQTRTLEDANATEEALIIQYDTRNPEKGFNLAKGGGHRPHPIRNKSKLIESMNQPETRAKISAANRGKVLSPEHRQKLSINAYRVRPVEMRARISQSLKQRGIKISGRTETHKLCKKHGLILIKDCLVRPRHDGRLRLDCKLCIQSYKKTYYRRPEVKARHNEQRRAARIGVGV